MISCLFLLFIFVLVWIGDYFIYYFNYYCCCGVNRRSAMLYAWNHYSFVNLEYRDVMDGKWFMHLNKLSVVFLLAIARRRAGGGRASVRGAPNSAGTGVIVGVTVGRRRVRSRAGSIPAGENPE